MSLIDALKSHFSSDTTSAIAQSLSESPQSVGTAVSGAIPTLLASLGSLASDPNGARSVMNAVRDTDPSVTSQGAGTYQGGQVMGLMESGGRALSSLFGGKSEGIISAISRFSGLGLGSSRSLISMLLPTILGFVGKSAASAGVSDASGLSGFFREQAGSIAGAMPSGLKQQLSGIPGISSWLQGASGVGAQAASAVSAGAQRAYSATTSAGQSTSRYVPWAVILALVVALLAWLVWPRSHAPTPQVATRTPPPAQPVAAQPAPAQPSLSEQARTAGSEMQDSAQKASATIKETTGNWIGDVQSLGDPELGTKLSSTFTDLGTTLTSVRSDNLDATQTKLQDLSQRVDGWQQTFASMAPEKQTKVRELLRNSLPAIENAANKAKSIPGAQEKIGPTTDNIIQKLRTYAQAQPAGES